MQTTQGLYINGRWLEGEGREITAVNPATGETLWQGKSATHAQAQTAVTAAKNNFPKWRQLSYEQRAEYLAKFTQILESRQQDLTACLAKETGKPLWEAKTEVSTMLAKLAISKQAYADRCKDLFSEQQSYISITRHKPHGVVLVLGPFNFPAHLPNGHIIPALLAGNTIVFKPSELTPTVSIMVLKMWEEAGLPAGVLNLVLGFGDLGQELVENRDIDGIFFTGSFATGHKIAETSFKFPYRIVALEMGGNNPLVVYKADNIDAAVYYTIQSAFSTAGQRCTCARRLIVVDDALGQQFVRKLITAVQGIKVGAYTETPEPFMGPLISADAANKVLESYTKLVQDGAKVLVPMHKIQDNLAFLTPAIIDVSSLQVADHEIFGPLLQLYWVNDLSQAIAQANNTSYGLSASLLSDDPDAYQEFYANIKAGVINWNRPTIGSLSSAPFGGVGKSGNHRPSAYYAADYCAYPVASTESSNLELPSTLNPGLKL